MGIVTLMSVKRGDGEGGVRGGPGYRACVPHAPLPVGPGLSGAGPALRGGCYRAEGLMLEEG